MTESSTASRLLRLLALLQARRAWSGSELADRVGVSPRTIRRDVDRLRELGYRIDADRGAIGGYRLQAGSDVPPLLFSSDEAMALALALRAGAATSPVRGFTDLTVSVIAKLEQVLPAAVRARVRAAQSAIVTSGPVRDSDLIDPESLARLALACRDSEIVRFGYTVPRGVTAERRVEPVALVPLGRHWHLLAWDTVRADWRSFRLDRITEVTRTHVTTTRRAVPAADAGEFLLERFFTKPAPLHAATIRVKAPLAEVEAGIGAFTSGLEADGDHTLWRISDERVELLFGALAWLSWPFEIVEGDSLRRFVRDFAGRVVENS